MPYPTEPSGLPQIVAFQLLSWLRDVAGSVRIALFQLFMCLFLFFTYAIPDQANDIFVALSAGELFQFTGLILSLILISYINWFMVRYMYVRLAYHNRLPSHYSEHFYRKVVEPIVTLFPFAAAILGFYFSVQNKYPFDRMIILVGVGGIWYITLTALIKKGYSPSLKKIMQSDVPALEGLKVYRIIIVLFLLLFASLVVMPQRTGWTQMFGPIITISLGFCFWAWVGSYVYLYSRLWFTPFIPIALTYVFFIAEPFNNNHAVRVIPYPVKERFTISQQIKNWLHHKYHHTKTDTAQVNVFIVAAEGGGIRSAYWTSGVLAWLEDKTHHQFHRNVMAVSGVSGGSVGLGFYTAGINALHGVHAPELTEHLRKTSSADFLSDITAGLVFYDVLQKGIPFPIGALDRGRKLEDAFSNSFTYNFYDKPLLDYGVCAEYAKNEKAFNPILLFNTTQVETGRKAIVSNCRISDDKKYYYDVIDVLAKAGQDVPLKCAMSMSARFPFVTPPALVDSVGGKAWGHVVDGGYFENSGLHTAWQTTLALEAIIKSELTTADSAYAAFLNRIQIQVVYLKNSFTSDEEDVPPLTVEEMAPANAFLNAWARRTVTDIKHFENNLAHSCFYMIKLQRAKNDGIPLGWYLSKKACEKIQSQLNHLDTMKSVKRLMKTLRVLE